MIPLGAVRRYLGLTLLIVACGSTPGHAWPARAAADTAMQRDAVRLTQLIGARAHVNAVRRDGSTALHGAVCD